MNAVASILSALLLLLSVPIFMVFGLGSATTAIWGMNLPWSTLIQVSFGSMTKHVLIAVPLFIFTGMVMLRGGAAARLVHFATTLVGHWPGGLGIAMVLAMGFFAAFCGSILAAITAVGTIMIPQMVQQGYPKPFVIVLAASAAFLEALIPPSNAAILFSALTDVPVSRTFAAGFVPGLVLLVLLSLVVTWRCRHLRNPKRATAGDRIRAFWFALPGLFTPVIILGGIYAGLLTPSESAAVAGIWAIFIGIFAYRELTLKGVLLALHETARITAVIFAIIAMATFLSVVLTYSQTPQKIISYFTEMGGSPLAFWLAVAVICLILGTFVEIVPVFYLTVPIFAALAVSLDQDILHLYIVFVAFAGIGMITPPVCVGIYTAAGVAKESPEKAFREVPLFAGVGIIFGILMIAFPQAATWLPDLLN
ncbi:TRAP transporter large permease [Alisedimentitalea sp. MJ-SS2]|uniref:TRAP transporter large permease n=1 Tax=Aliisedimentitalea sp. MJ-SS2 TaxID=3049795 RepID=UPI002907031C|nr:TRAP transporter large permease [Alisedimentitalea sp. MJ-SS2]MDU8925916.1 TRAP transporter large permease [Alisedimentitalea sp. MJ-SS2]